MRTEPYGSQGKFQMEVIIPIPLDTKNLLYRNI